MTAATGSARLFNAALAATAVAALDELGVLDALRDRGSLSLDGVCAERDLHRPSLVGLLDVLHREGVVELAATKDQVRPGALFAEAFRDKGYFLWLVRGYGNMLENLGSLVRNQNRHGSFYQRNGRYIAMAGRDYGAQFVDSDFEAFLGESPFRVAADVGCGSAERLIRIALARPDLRGVGVDLSAGAVSLARENVAARGLSERIQVVQADVTELPALPELRDVEVMWSFFMGHDLWPRDCCIATLGRIRAACPALERFLLCDTFRSDLPPGEPAPIFTLGFEVTHAVMGQYIPSVEEWLEVFSESGWRCAGRRDIGIPFSTVFDLRREAGPA